MLFHIEQRPNAEAEAKEEEEEEEEEEEKEANGEAGSDQNRDPNVKVPETTMKPKLKSILGAFPLHSILVVTQLFSP